MDPNEIIRPQEEQTVWIYTRGKNEGQVAPANHVDARPVIRTTVYRKDGRVEVWQRSPDQGPEFGVLMPAPVSYTDDKIAEQYQKDLAKQQAEAEKPPAAPPTRVINGVPHERGEDGVYRPVQTEAGAATPGATSQAQAAAPGGKPYIDDGPEAGQTGRRWGWNPETRLYDRDLGPSPSAQKPPEAADRVGKPTGNTRERTEGGKTIKETEYVLPDGTTTWRTQEAPAAASSSGSVVLKPDGKGGTIAIRSKPDGTIETIPVPGVPSDVPEPKSVDVNGVRYERGPDGTYRRAAGLPSEGEATATGPGGPKMPNILVGASSGALTQLHRDLAADPTKTPAQRERMFQEAVQVAVAANNDYTVQQRERESARNAEVNLATNRLSYMQTGMGQALDFVMKFNGTLPVGSPLGGQAFMALLGMQMIQMKRSGIDDIPGMRNPETGRTNPYAETPPPPPLTITDLSDPKAMAAKREEIMAHPVFRPQPEAQVPAAAETPIPPPNAIGAGAVPSSITPTPTTEAAGAPVPSTPPAAPAAAVPETPVSMGQPAGGSAWEQVRAAYGQEQQQTAAQPGTPPAAPAPTPPGPPAIAPATPPQYGVLASMPSIDQGTPMPQAVQMPPVQPVQTPPTPPPPNYTQPMPPAMLGSLARTRAPWQLDDQTIEAMIAAGIPKDQIFAVPGRMGT